MQYLSISTLELQCINDGLKNTDLNNLGFIRHIPEEWTLSTCEVGQKKSETSSTEQICQYQANKQRKLIKDANYT